MTSSPLPEQPASGPLYNHPSPISLSALSILESSLLAAFNPDRPWTGRLSSSAIATAIAVFALHTAGAATHRRAVETGLAWLNRTRNPDGGWGDSPDSPTNITATMLATFALHATASPPLASSAPLCKHSPLLSTTIHHSPVAFHDPRAILSALRDRYGSDSTFAAPILTMGALSGCLGRSPVAWSFVPQLPFELAACPDRWFRRLNMGVVSYGLPALIAIGLVRHKNSPSRLLPLRLLRDHLTPRLLEIAQAMQPSNGGYEEATPLTGFVTMSLAAAGFRDHDIVRRGVAFLLASQRPDGSWPIDTDLATWVTAQSVCALTEPGAAPCLTTGMKATIRRWLLAQQHTARHPLTCGSPGGWGWTNLPGAMPDADDTAGVLLALHRLGDPTEEIILAAADAVQWLLNLQNRDGGIPTFCRGWGRLPFDRSCPDITAHTLEAFAAWHPDLSPSQARAVTHSMRLMLSYLAKSQTRHGAWLPLWFGTQTTQDEANPVYGTARTVLALARAQPFAARHLAPAFASLLEKGRAFLLHTQHANGGWAAQAGLTPSIEETAMALAAMAGSEHRASIDRGAQSLLELTRNGTHTPASPIGLYFARLWYSEQLYPAIFSITALRRVLASQTIANGSA